MAAKEGEHGAGIAFELPPGDPNDLESSGLQVGIAGPPSGG
jgi:hypothetical protein